MADLSYHNCAKTHFALASVDRPARPLLPGVHSVPGRPHPNPSAPYSTKQFIHVKSLPLRPSLITPHDEPCRLNCPPLRSSFTSPPLPLSAVIKENGVLFLIVERGEHSPTQRFLADPRSPAATTFATDRAPGSSTALEETATNHRHEEIISSRQESTEVSSESPPHEGAPKKRHRRRSPSEVPRDADRRRYPCQFCGKKFARVSMNTIRAHFNAMLSADAGGSRLAFCGRNPRGEPTPGSGTTLSSSSHEQRAYTEESPEATTFHLP